MIPINFNSALSLAEAHGYLFIFLIMVFEGPIITTATAFAASLGYFNITIIFMLSLFGDLTGDGIFYMLGRTLRVSSIEILSRHLGIKNKDIKKLERLMNKHFSKAIFLIKLVPAMAVPGLMLSGATKVSPKKFAFYSFMITLPRTIFFVGLGYYFGVLIDTVLRYFKLGEHILSVSVIVMFIVYLAYRKMSSSITRKVERQI